MNHAALAASGAATGSESSLRTHILTDAVDEEVHLPHLGQ